ncbi:uncharacterized protein LOC124282747 isoform X2 [Haliotis rubra]|uniref:uncharacterized protein LOC124282747 isoform X2 n=1 Tax=Haliotis rubra TaxID=36100 RepID=UPI001EE5D030|nr:uncharacterized protein LOC124282747 isoform X2 [Haliotis rubra]
MEIPRWIRFFSDEDFRDYQQQARMYRGKICQAMEEDCSEYQLSAITSLGEYSNTPTQAEYTSSCTAPLKDMRNEAQPTVNRRWGHLDQGHERISMTHKAERPGHQSNSKGGPESRTPSKKVLARESHSAPHKERRSERRRERRTTSFKERTQERHQIPYIEGGNERRSTPKTGGHDRHPSSLKLGGQKRHLTTLTLNKGDKSNGQELDHNSNETSGNSTLELINFKNPKRNPVVLSCLILLVVLILGATVLVIYFILNQKQGLPQVPSEVEKFKGMPAVTATVRLKILNKSYKPSMNQSISVEFKSIAEPFATELDKIFLLSSLEEAYYGARVQRLNPGSIRTDTDLLLLDTGLVKDAEMIRRTITDSAKTVTYREVPAVAIGDFIVCADCITVDMHNIILDVLPPKPRYPNTRAKIPTTSSTARTTQGATVTTKQSGITPTTVTTPTPTDRMTSPLTSHDISSTTNEEASSPSTITMNEASNMSTTSVSTLPSAAMTATTSVTTTTKTPTIHMSSTATSIGTDAAKLTCAVKFVDVWNYLLVVHDTPTEVVPIITLNPNGSYSMAKEDIKSNLIVTVDARDESVILTLTFKNVSCSDEGNYACTLFTSEDMYTAHGLLEIVNIPTQPRLSLPVELISNRKIKEPISCVGNVGYPEGFLFLQMKSKSSPHFTTLPAHVTYDRRECHVTATAQLTGFSPTLEANGTIIRCAIENSRLLSRDDDVSTAAVMAVLPDNICGQTVNGSIRHPYSCSKSIVCTNSVPSVGQCPGELCFDPSSGECGQVALSLRTSTGSLNEGLTAIACRLLHLGTWDILSVKRQTTSGYEYDIMHVHNNGSVDWLDSNLESRALSEVFISKYEAEVLIWISVLKCADEGRYVCGASGIPSLTQAQSTLSVISKPEEPILTVPAQVVENDPSQHEITCRAEVGYPAGRLGLKFRLKNETDFQRVEFDSTETKTHACRTQIEGKYVMTGGSNLNETLVICEVESNLTQAKSVTEMLFIIPENYCGNENNTSLEHPFDCRYYIQCPGGGIYVSKCSVGLCFNPVNKQCDLPEPTEKKDDPSHPCYPNRHGEYLPHPFICNKFYWCVGGREEVQHCQQGTLYLGEGQCTFDVEESHCYNALNTTVPAV